ncbi:hypothetical protein [Zavarzinia sp. CC-PAN008]|uniref:hypothetical protein n=1 Tax=Zavarzinia sp. CC-PAN008 TaxID=3243332 RepID=UPI003F747C43
MKGRTVEQADRDGRIPVIVLEPGSGMDVLARVRPDRPGTLYITGGRHEAALPMPSLGNACLCCTGRSDLVDLLRRSFLQRVRGEIADFDRVVIATDPGADATAIRAAIASDVLLAARYRVGTAAT